MCADETRCSRCDFSNWSSGWSTSQSLCERSLAPKLVNSVSQLWIAILIYNSDAQSTPRREPKRIGCCLKLADLLKTNSYFVTECSQPHRLWCVFSFRSSQTGSPLKSGREIERKKTVKQRELNWRTFLSFKEAAVSAVIPLQLAAHRRSVVAPSTAFGFGFRVSTT